MKELTDKQGRALDAIRSGIKHDGFPPTSRELAEILTVSQTMACKYITALEKKGAITRTAGQSRTIRII